MRFVKAYWKWMLLGLAIILIAYGAWHRTDKTLFKLLATAYQEQAQHVTDTRDAQIAQLAKDRDKVISQLVKVQQEKAIYVQKYNASQKRVKELEHEIDIIVVPTDLDALINDLHQRGYKSAIRSSRPR